MKKFLIICTSFIAFAGFSQTERSSEMTMPEYPALSIIGSQTSEITKPGDYSALLASVVSPMVSNNGTIPANLALEFNPYYFKAERRTLDEYLKRDVLSSLKRTSKISIASNSVLGSDSTLYSRVGLGYRAFLFDGKLTNIYSENIKQAEQINFISITMDLIKELPPTENIDETNLDQVLPEGAVEETSTFYQDIKSILINPDLSKEEKLEQLNALNEGLSNSKGTWVKAEVYNRSIRSGFFWEVAAAVSIDFAEQKLNNGELQRFGIWSIFTFRPENASSFDGSLLIRYSNYSLDPTAVFTTSGNFGDAGLNLKWKPIKWLTLSGEYILRYGFNDYAVSTGEIAFVNVASGASESKLSLVGVIHVSDQVSATFTYSNINGESSYTQEGIQSLLIGLTAAILPAK